MRCSPGVVSYLAPPTHRNIEYLLQWKQNGNVIPFYIQRMVETWSLLTNLRLSETKVRRVWLTLSNFHEFDKTRRILTINYLHYSVFVTASRVWHQPPRLRAHSSFFLFCSFGAKPSPFIFIRLTLACRVREGRAECVMKSACRKNTSRWLLPSQFCVFLYCTRDSRFRTEKEKNLWKAIVPHPMLHFWLCDGKNTNRQSFKRWTTKT